MDEIKSLRLDLLLVKRGHFPSRAKAQEAIKAGRVKINGKTCVKSGQSVPDCVILDVAQGAIEAVGRGSAKLTRTLEFFKLDVRGKVCLDVGASTGGFTQVLLEAGARRVFALDVGRGQLAEPLRSDPRVLNLEGRNFRYFDPAGLPEPPGFACADVSFISLKLILPKLAEVLPKDTEAVCLVKPQFEAGREALNKHGVVKDPKAHARVLEEVAEAARGCGFEVLGSCESPILGGDGNREFLMYLTRM